MSGATTGLRPAMLHFEAGRCTGLTTYNPETQQHDTYKTAQLVSYDLLSIPDRMILDQIAARVDKLARQLASAGENRG